MSLDELTNQQAKTGAEIERHFRNFKKDSIERKTKDYLDERIKVINELWENFKQKDQEIKTTYSIETDHAYFKRDYFAAVSRVYEGFIEQLNKMRGQSDLESEVNAGDASGTSSLVRGQSDVDLKKPSDDTVLTDKFSTTAIDELSSQSSIKIDITINSALQRLHRKISALKCKLDDIEILSDAEPKSVYGGKRRYIEQLWSKIDQIYEELDYKMVDLDSAGFNMEEYDALNERMHQSIAKLEEFSTDKFLQHRREFIDTSPQIKLPTISLPKFDGNYLNWKPFHDLFCQMVHEQDLGNAQKMWYLKTSLTGEAQRLIQHMNLSDENYMSAWTMLKNRYSNARLLVSALINKLLAQPTIHTESAAAIRSLHDVTQECLLSLDNLKIPTENWDPLLLHLLIKKLDNATHSLYEQGLSQPKNIQSIQDFLKFLEKRFQSLESLGIKTKNVMFNDQRANKASISRILTTTTSRSSCIACKGEHQLFTCNVFLKLSPDKRLRLVQAARYCVNCLKSGHRSNECSSGHCIKCSKKHNTLLHLEKLTTYPQSKEGRSIQHSSYTNADHFTIAKQPVTNNTETSTSLSANHPVKSGTYVVLSTAIIKLTDKWGNTVNSRAILDSGSQLNFISESLVKKLGFRGNKEILSIEGIGQRKQETQRRVNVQIQSKITGFQTNIEAHILPKIISPQPSQQIDASSWPIPNNIQLADPHFHRPGTIDILIGAELFYSTLAVGQIKLGDNMPILQNTVFGWTIAGRTKTSNFSQNSAYCGVCSEDESLDSHIQRFWQLEETEHQSHNYTLAEKKCENFYVQTTNRKSDGRIMVRLPFKDDPKKLGESSEAALRRFYSLERRLLKNPELKQQYVHFMKEYVELGHMEEVCFTMVEEPYFFLPHHCVLKPSSTTTKLRVVFDGSAKTTSNLSLNDILSTGPAIQDDVFTVLLRFRMPRYVFTAEIEKMYRQILVDPVDRKYQLIWWRDDTDPPLKCYTLNTVTYGTAPASYLAIRSIHKLANDVQGIYPLAAEVLKHDLYVDDIMTGSDKIDLALKMQNELISALSTSGMKARKWCSNHPQLLQNIPSADQAIEVDFTNQSKDAVRTMGLTWHPKTDTFSIQSTWLSSQKITKRTASSDIAHIFDPLGILAPVVITAKLFLQRLWKLKLDWDASLPQDLHTTWLNFRDSLKSLSAISFPRHVFSHNVPKRMQLHIFADASEKAYGAAAYVRAINQNNIVIVRLLCAKSKVAPTNHLTLPRLELCAAKLAIQLMQRIKKDLRLENEQIFLWTDSMIVLGWINAESSSFHTFVANRISAIQEFTIPEQWRHVKSADNPADFLSRGVSPEALATKHLWFYGPTFLHGNEIVWPQPYTHQSIINLEKREKSKSTFTAVAVQEPTTFIENIDHRNSFRRLQRIIAYMFRFIDRSRHCFHGSISSTLTVEELNNSQATIIKHIQQKEFADDIRHLTKYKELSTNSSISSLAPFLDDKGILRVGGRLESSALSYNAKYPMLLPYSHQFSRLILSDLHKENMHAGPQTLLSITRQQFWPTKGKILARAIVQHCVQCTRTKPKLLSQLMGNLPIDRVQPARPFINSGVDFCGPVFTHYKGRGRQPQKAYISVFCCFATKAVHLELVSDLSTDGFLGALRRFTARRGHCRKIYCDNATNFVGAKNQLLELACSINNHISKQKISSECSAKGIDFNFIPPRAPHFGGLWEAAVKSAKHLLQHSLASASLTYEEMETVIIEAEAILNSRPITPLSSDPNDLTALTPAHFLIGEPLTSTVDPQARPMNINLLIRWKLVTHIKHDFWKRWSKEYLNLLQQRYKWKKPCPNVKLDTMVIIKDDNLPPLKWQLGRVVKVVKGEDGLVRVVDVKTKTNVLRRPIHSLAPLPIEMEDSEEAITTTSKDKLETVASSSEKFDVTENRVQNPTKRARSSFGSALVTMLFACLIMPASTNPVAVTPFKTNPGLYFENMGGSNIISSEWNIITYYDMQPFWKELDLLHNCSSVLDNISSTMHNPGPYTGISKQIKHVINELDQANELLQTPGPQRAKRGALNIVGNVANALFGVLDSNYAEEMSVTIDNIHQNENHIVALLRNQTSILDTTVNVMKRNHQAIETELTRVDSYLNRISSKIDAIHDERHEERLNQRLSALVLQTLLTITNFQRSQNLILDALASTYQGKFTRNLISPNQLRNVLTTIRINLPPTLKLPIDQEDILKYYNMMSLEGRMTTKHIIFKLRLPLISSEDYELFKLIPVPVKINGTFVAIRPSFPYLIVNLYRQQYYPLAESELKTCLTIHEKYLCKQRHPLYKIGSSISECEIKLLNDMDPNSTCQIMKMKYESIWIQMHNANSWIYSLNEKTTINIVCGENTTQLALEDAGILKINSDCTIKQPLITIQGHTVYSTIQRSSYKPFFNLSEIVSSYNTTHTLRYQHHYSADINELDAIKQQIQDINIQLPGSMGSHHTHHYALGYAILAIISCIIIILIRKLRCNGRSSSPSQNVNKFDAVKNHQVNTAINNCKNNTSEDKFTIDLGI